MISAVTAIDSMSVQVDWRRPINPNGVLTTYTIVYNIKDGDNEIVNVPYNMQPVSDLE